MLPVILLVGEFQIEYVVVISLTWSLCPVVSVNSLVGLCYFRMAVVLVMMSIPWHMTDVGSWSGTKHRVKHILTPAGNQVSFSLSVCKSVSPSACKPLSVCPCVCVSIFLSFILPSYFLMIFNFPFYFSMPVTHWSEVFVFLVWRPKFSVRILLQTKGERGAKLMNQSALRIYLGASLLFACVCMHVCVCTRLPFVLESMQHFLFKTDYLSVCPVFESELTECALLTVCILCTCSVIFVSKCTCLYLKCLCCLILDAWNKDDYSLLVWEQ